MPYISCRQASGIVEEWWMDHYERAGSPFTCAVCGEPAHERRGIPPGIVIDLCMEHRDVPEEQIRAHYNAVIKWW